jgi:beta-glucosidase
MRATVLFVLAVAPLMAAAQQPARHPARPPAQPTLGARRASLLEREQLRFRDLNRNGVLDPYEDWRLDAAARARDLVGRMTLDEKAGAMMHGSARGAAGGMPGAGARYDAEQNRAMIVGRGVNSMITRLSGDPATLAAENDALQEIAEGTRLGIPVTVSTDPRNHFQYTAGASVQPGGFSQWPEPLGLAAIGDAALVRRFGDVARQEYRAVGIHEALSPQADLATEPRWSRINGTFGEDAALARRMVEAYVEGFQHGAAGVDAIGVAAVVKHWVGYGAQTNGFDSHNAYGRTASLSAPLFQYHVAPFLGAFAAHVAGVMPTYSILDGLSLGGQPVEPVGAGFNAQLVNGLLRGRYGYRGVVVTDWAITNDCSARCRDGVPAGERPSFADVGMPWGVERLSKPERFARAVSAGVDQFGGTEEAQFLVDAVHAGQLTEARLDTSVLRIVAQKFAQGLFENPYVDSAVAARIVGSAQFRAEGIAAQRRALVLLENRKAVLPIASTTKRVYLHGIDRAVVEGYGLTVVDSVGQAQLAIVRSTAPFETLHPGYVFGAMQHEGRLDFRADDAEFAEVARIMAAVPTVVTVYLDRPAIVTPLRDHAAALLGNFGVSDAALLDVLTGRAKPEGRLPFELPASMAAVEAQRSDTPHDSGHPLYAMGFGRRYGEAGGVGGARARSSTSRSTTRSARRGAKAAGKGTRSRAR